MSDHRFNSAWLIAITAHLGLDAAELARLTGATPMVIRTWLTDYGWPRCSHLGPLARALGGRQALMRLVGFTADEAKGAA